MLVPSCCILRLMSNKPDFGERELVTKHVTLVTVELPNPNLNLVPVARTTTVLTICMAVFPQGLVTADRKIARPGSGCLVYVPRTFNSLLRSQRDSVTVSRAMSREHMQRAIDRLTSEFLGVGNRADYISVYISASTEQPILTRNKIALSPEEQVETGQEVLLLNRVAIKYPIEEIVQTLLMRKV